MCFTHLQLNYVYTKLRYLIIFYSIKRYFSEKYKNIILIYIFVDLWELYVTKGNYTIYIKGKIL